MAVLHGFYAGSVSRGSAQPSTLVPIAPRGNKVGHKTPLFCVAGILGNVFDFHPLSRCLGPEQPVYGLRALGLDEDSPPYTRMEDMAAHHIEAIRTVQPNGPYAIAGYSFGGKVAFEMARQLVQQGHGISLLAVVDIHLAVPESEKRVSEWGRAETIMWFARIYGGALPKGLRISHETLWSLDEQGQLAYSFGALDRSRADIDSGGIETAVIGFQGQPSSGGRICAGENPGSHHRPAGR
uniref:Thioesterase domain-containing protein n=1 Tax=Candidatus Kentrum eta TaxID=2126337 RepID=A0A450UV93_9GAMM|nr:MAG: Thioesterase domain-containing protein [Candidatus Kentron sp. H]VFJ90104.1 MAG: Thioesterase domain-containing protein [Candidatus Kentron sp. H]VFJ96474.1 MAG: Thioesterase domain-containing protein [Candidatus Kentron sp. H]